MAIFRIRVSLPTGRFAYTALFKDSKEATRQTMADYPAATAIAIIFIKRQGRAAT